MEKAKLKQELFQTVCHPNGIFAHSVWNQGDIVLAINGYKICADENFRFCLSVCPSTGVQSPNTHTVQHRAHITHRHHIHQGEK